MQSIATDISPAVKEFAVIDMHLDCSLYHGGLLAPGEPIIKPLWLTKNKNRAVKYAKWASSETFILEVLPIKTLRLIVFPEYPISSFDNIYKQPPLSSEFNNDLVAALIKCHPSSDVDGYIFKEGDEIFISNTAVWCRVVSHEVFSA